jgi:hypothetical protein
MSKLTYEVAKSLWHYDPDTGDLFRATNLSDPIRKLWYPEKDGKGYRCQVNHDGANYNYKAAQVAWVLLTKADLGTKVDVMHLNGDATNNKAANLYLQVPPGLGDTRGPMTVLTDSPLARAIMPEGEPHPDGTLRAHIVIHGDGNYARGYTYLTEKELARFKAANYQGECRHASQLVVEDMNDFAAWCKARHFPSTMDIDELIEALS